MVALTPLVPCLPLCRVRRTPCTSPPLCRVTARFYGLQNLNGWENLAIQVPFFFLFLVLAGVILKYVQYGKR